MLVHADATGPHAKRQDGMFLSYLFEQRDRAEKTEHIRRYTVASASIGDSVPVATTHHSCRARSYSGREQTEDPTVGLHISAPRR